MSFDCLASPNKCGKEVGNDGAACSTYESSIHNPRENTGMSSSTYATDREMQSTLLTGIDWYVT
jgi:hypothetical protein